MRLSSPPEQRFHLDLKGYQLLDQGRPVRLERQPMELLILLAGRKGQLVTRDEIASRLWGDGVFVDADRNINSIVRKLRLALDDDPDSPAFLETVVGKGYRFVGPLAITPAGVDETAASLPAESAVHASAIYRRRVVWGLAVLVCAVFAFSVWLISKRSGFAGGLPPARSIAILPLENLEGSVAPEYFADGLTQELTTELAEDSELRVISHTSVLPYKQVHKPASEIARELHVDAVIEGSVLRSGDRVRVSIRLIRLPSEDAIWASTYERDLREILALQRDLAEDIAEHVRIKLVRNISPARAGQLPPAAHDAYLQGVSHYENNTEAELRQAVADFQNAVSLAPNYAAAYAGMADSYAELGIFYRPPPETMPQAKAAALKALELDPDLSEAHEAIASVYYYYDWDWAGAERELRKAIELNPSNAIARDLLASYYGTVGRFEDSMAELGRARELAPHSAMILGDTVFWPFLSRNYKLAITNGEAAVAAQPDNSFAHVFLGMAYAEQGRTADALRHADLAQSYDNGPLIASFRANVYAIAGQRPATLAALRAVEKQRVEHYSCAYEIGTAYILVNQIDRGFEWLNNAYQSRSECMILLKIDPRLDSIRSDARYEKLLRAVGLEE